MSVIMSYHVVTLIRLEALVSVSMYCI